MTRLLLAFPIVWAVFSVLYGLMAPRSPRIPRRVRRCGRGLPSQLSG